jgi:very-short-patch-repair endonuclease
LLLELDGDTHADPAAQEQDARRTEYLERRGLKVLRFWNVELAENEEGVVSRIFDECTQRAGIGSAGEPPHDTDRTTTEFAP